MQDVDLWTMSASFPESPLFTGGVLDAWPAKAVDVLRVCREEQVAIQRFLMHQRLQEGRQGRG